jgi:hypothetical protein
LQRTIIGTREGKEVSSDRSQPRQAVRCRKGKEQTKEKAMIARFDHRPMLTAVLALSTTVLVVVVITLSTLLITAPQAASPPSLSGGGNPAAPAGAAGADAGQGFSSESLAEHKAEVLAAQSGHFTQESPAEKKAEVVAAKSGHFAP